MDQNPVKIYMAGPDVFLRNAAEVARKKKEVLSAHGLEGHHPFDNDVEAGGLTPEEVAQIIFSENIAMMNRCDVLLANLTPFRGPSADVGTVFELGYMYGMGKPVFGYSNVNRTYLERIRDYSKKPVTCDKDGMMRDHDNLSIENFNLRDNLMIEGALKGQELPPHHGPDLPPGPPWVERSHFISIACSKPEQHTNLTAFTRQVENIARLRDSGLLFKKGSKVPD